MNWPQRKNILSLSLSTLHKKKDNLFEVNLLVIKDFSSSLYLGAKRLLLLLFYDPLNVPKDKTNVTLSFSFYSSIKYKLLCHRNFYQYFFSFTIADFHCLMKVAVVVLCVFFTLQSYEFSLRMFLREFSTVYVRCLHVDRFVCFVYKFNA